MNWNRTLSLIAGIVGILGTLYLANSIIWEVDGSKVLPYGQQVFATSTSVATAISAYLALVTVGKNKAEKILKNAGFSVPTLIDIPPKEWPTAPVVVVEPVVEPEPEIQVDISDIPKPGDSYFDPRTLSIEVMQDDLYKTMVTHRKDLAKAKAEEAKAGIPFDTENPFTKTTRN